MRNHLNIWFTPGHRRLYHPAVPEATQMAEPGVEEVQMQIKNYCSFVLVKSCKKTKQNDGNRFQADLERIIHPELLGG
ncbi:hypothetical protein [Jeotgalibacillus soli]|nr:hypothetical protein [Jeotgalibacillus soli]